MVIKLLLAAYAAPPVLSALAGLLKKRKEMILSAALMAVQEAFALGFLIFYVFLAEAGPYDPPLAAVDHIVVYSLLALYCLVDYFSIRQKKGIVLGVFSRIMGLLLLWFLFLGVADGAFSLSDQVSVNRFACFAAFSCYSVMIALSDRRRILNVLKRFLVWSGRVLKSRVN